MLEFSKTNSMKRLSDIPGIGAVVTDLCCDKEIRAMIDCDSVWNMIIGKLLIIRI